MPQATRRKQPCWNSNPGLSDAKSTPRGQLFTIYTGSNGDTLMSMVVAPKIYWAQALCQGSAP